MRRIRASLTVASCAEAWIETTIIIQMPRDRVSPPARRRGSKRRRPLPVSAVSTSPPARRRGSKPQYRIGRDAHLSGRLLRGGVDRNQPLRRIRASLTVPYSAEAEISTTTIIQLPPDRVSHPARRRGSIRRPQQNGRA